jgi:hypothetical protein
MRQAVDVPADLFQEIRSFPLERAVEHCGRSFFVSPFDFYAECPQCHARVKVRACSGVMEIEDVFDAVFAWMSQPGAEELVRRRQQVMKEDDEE